MADVDPKLGELIKKTRLERRLTQEEVAEMIGCHSQYYKNLENGKGMPSVPMFCKIMRALHISSDEYVWPNQNRNNPTSIALPDCVWIFPSGISCFCGSAVSCGGLW